jgi:non-ribosomal peptide synthetase component F
LQLSTKEGTTLFVVLTAALKAMLYSRTGQTNLIMATLVSTRDQHADLVSTVGNLTDFLLLRTDLSGNPTFCELMARVKATVLEAVANAAPVQLVLDAASPIDHPFMRVAITDARRLAEQARHRVRNV